ncbi:methyltransferase [Candidatus Tenderia electrophaga]|jgi:sarcosine/dimethylglycine N-methyltransferase|uniref:Methyltransferase n=1 Tax=Candidatus Tenderia electrophaga TaxID=1748243 RepID=A0A0S2TCP8_9GAMM|nr:methyltransferase [Candidatus Tenderia electrophaga]
MSSQYSDAVNTAREYYNSEDADNFYAIIWGGEDIHIGLYQSDDESIPEASHRTVRHMAEKTKLTPQDKVLDIGSGYGGLARYLAETFGCSVVALNLSEKENERARKLNKERGLDDKIEVVDGSFENIPAEDKAFDVIFSQDAILHSGQREKVLQEVARVLKPGGKFIFTDPMAADDCPAGVLEPILNRIHLSSLGSPAFYRETAAKFGMKELNFEELTHQLVNHYSRVLQETEKHEAELTKKVDKAYVERMKTGLGHWINGGKNGHLAWGFFVFEKEA